MNKIDYFAEIGIEDLAYIQHDEPIEESKNHAMYFEKKSREKYQEIIGDTIKKSTLFGNEFDGSNLKHRKQMGGIILEAKYTSPKTKYPDINQYIVSFTNLLAVEKEHEAPVSKIFFFSEENAITKFSDHIEKHHYGGKILKDDLVGNLELWHYDYKTNECKKKYTFPKNHQ